MRSKISKNFRFILITGLVVFFLLVMVTPVSAELRTIKQGATIFIGESNLDITNAVGSSNTIGWWASTAITSSDPIKTFNLAGKQTAFTVTPSDFIGSTGNWYRLAPDGKTAQGVAFIVADPTLDIRVWDLDSNKDVTGDAVRAVGWPTMPNVYQGERLTFRIYTNQYLAVNPQYRPNANPATDGYITIHVKGGSNGMTLTSLPQTNGVSNSLNVPLYVDSNNWQWGGSNSANTYWTTDAPSFIERYGVSATSNLNGMYTLYLIGGVPPEGKTESIMYYGFNVVSNTVSINAPNSVVRGGGISIQIRAAPYSTPYDLYINNGDVSGITPPTLDPYYQTTYPLISPGHYQIPTDHDGAATLRFLTSSQTTPRVYTFKLVDPTGKQHEAHTDVEVLPVPPASIGNIVVQSSPAGATIFLDNAIKGITPLTINTVPNGNHVVLLRLNGYQDSSSTINILGDTQTINPTLTPIGIATTGATTIPTTASVTTTTTTGTTTTTTTGAVTTQLTTIVTTATPTPTAKINYSATIAAMQSQIAEQGTKITEQGNILDQIMTFLRNVFGFK